VSFATPCTSEIKVKEGRQAIIKFFPEQIESALYGSKGKGQSQVAQKIKTSVSSGQTWVKADNATFGDPCPHVEKELQVKINQLRVESGGQLIKHAQALNQAINAKTQSSSIFCCRMLNDAPSIMFTTVTEQDPGEKDARKRSELLRAPGAQVREEIIMYSGSKFFKYSTYTFNVQESSGGAGGAVVTSHEEQMVWVVGGMLKKTPKAHINMPIKGGA